MKQKHFWIFVLALHALFMGKQMCFGNSLLQDSKEYIFAADNLIHHNTLYSWNINHAYNPDWLTKRPFLYPFILVLIKFFSFGSEKLFFFMVYLLQNLVSIFCIRLCLRIAKKNHIVFDWWKAMLFMLFSISQIIYANMVMSEIWLELSIIGIVYILLSGPLSRPKFMMIALLMIAGMSLKPVFMFSAFLFPIIYIIYQYKSFRLGLFAVTLLPLIYFISISRWNQSRTGYFQYSSISTINLLHYNTYTTLMYKLGVEKADSTVDEIKAQAHLMKSYKEQQLYIQHACTKELINHLGTYSFLHLRGVVFCLLDPGRFDVTQFFGLPHKQNMIYETNRSGALRTILKTFTEPLGVFLLVLVGFNSFRTWVGLKFIFDKNVAKQIKIIMLAFPVYVLGLTGPIGTSRFFMPLIPIAFIVFLFVISKKKSPL